MRLEDKVAIITGGGQGIGRAYAVRFAQEGAKVAVADIIEEKAQKVAEEIKSDGGQALAFFTDVSDETSTVQMARKTKEQFGGIDILVNNAAIYYGLRRTSWDTWTADEWNNQLRINVLGMWLCIKAVVPYMVEQRKGKVVNISSAVVWSGQANMLPYNCSKGAVNAMTAALAKELGIHNINVNAIAPGWALSEAGREAYKDKLEAVREQVLNARSIKRDMMPDDLVGTAVFLASDDSDFITGQAVCIDGGINFRC